MIYELQLDKIICKINRVKLLRWVKSVVYLSMPEKLFYYICSKNL